jgi:hypothetical protein
LLLELSLGLVSCELSFVVARFLLSSDQDDIDMLQRAMNEVELQSSSEDKIGILD